MKRLLCLTAGILMVGLLTVGCAANPPGLASPRTLTSAEKQKAIQTALNTPEAKAQRAQEQPYESDMAWAAIVWQGTSNASWKGISSDWSTDPNRSLVPPSARYYIDVSLTFGQPRQWQVYVDIDADSGEVVLVQNNLFDNIPYPAKPVGPPPGVSPVPDPRPVAPPPAPPPRPLN